MRANVNIEFLFFVLFCVVWVLGIELRPSCKVFNTFNSPPPQFHSEAVAMVSSIVLGFHETDHFQKTWRRAQFLPHSLDHTLDFHLKKS